MGDDLSSEAGDERRRSDLNYDYLYQPQISYQVAQGRYRRVIHSETELLAALRTPVSSCTKSAPEKTSIATAAAVKVELAECIEHEMRRHKISKPTLAECLKTSESQIDLLLNNDSDDVTLSTLLRAAQFIGRNLQVELVNKT